MQITITPEDLKKYEEAMQAVVASRLEVIKKEVFYECGGSKQVESAFSRAYITATVKVPFPTILQVAS
jgi:threonyl-tRNA synthetase